MKTVQNSYDVIIIGAGAAGMTAAAYLTKAGKNILLIEKEEQCGGLVNSFERNGFVFDGGIRALENAGVLFPMLRQLGIQLDFVPNDVTIGIKDRVIALQNKASLEDYQKLLCHFFPDDCDDIQEITAAMNTIAHYMDIQYGIDNPMFLDPIKDGKYFLTDVIPWMFKYLFTNGKIAALDIPVRSYLRRFTENESLIDVIAQHFFTDTPASFALSYLTLYLDYHYPKGGTGQFINKLQKYIIDHGGHIQTSTKIIKIHPENQLIFDSDEKGYAYHTLIWSADQKSFFDIIDTDDIRDAKTIKKITQKEEILQDAVGNDSVLTVCIETDLPPDYFSRIASSHFFYSPTIRGDSTAGEKPFKQSKENVRKWLNDFLTNTTYEISIPVLRDPSLAPEGKTGLIVSVLLDYSLTAEIHTRGWYEEFKEIVEKKMIQTLENSIFPTLASHTQDTFSFTPLSIEKKVGTFQGAITGWAFTNTATPAQTKLIRINAAVKTPFYNILQAGMWTYSPAGFPVALITGKLASDQALNN